MRIVVLQHVSFEGPAMLVDWAAEHGHYLSVVNLYRGDPYPKMEELDMLVIMGGPMDMEEEENYPWLAGEKTYIKAAIDEGKYVLGICLGAQLIAYVLGTKISLSPHKEIGWYPIKFIDDALDHPVLKDLKSSMTVFHWHRNRFEIPEGAIHLASSEGCNNQAFIYKDRVLGLQFHLEMDEAAIRKIIKVCRSDIEEGSYVQGEDIILNKTAKMDTKQIMNALLDNWLH